MNSHIDIGTEEDSIHQLDTAAQVTVFRLRTGHYNFLSHLHGLKISHSDECPCGTLRSSNPQPHPAVLPHLQRFETPDVAQSGGCLQEALWTSSDTVADCRLCLTHRTEDLAWPGMQKNEKNMEPLSHWIYCQHTFSEHSAFLPHSKDNADQTTKSELAGVKRMPLKSS